MAPSILPQIFLPDTVCEIYNYHKIRIKIFSFSQKLHLPPHEKTRCHVRRAAPRSNENVAPEELPKAEVQPNLEIPIFFP